LWPHSARGRLARQTAPAQADGIPHRQRLDHIGLRIVGPGQSSDSSASTIGLAPARGSIRPKLSSHPANSKHVTPKYTRSKPTTLISGLTSGEAKIGAAMLRLSVLRYRGWCSGSVISSV